MTGRAGFCGGVMGIQTVAILGPGLLGGSLALELSGRGGISVRLWGRRQAALDQAVAMGFAGLATTDLASAASGCDLVVLATPVGVMRDLAERLAVLPSPPRLVTDMGSVKAMVEEEVAPVLRRAGIAFVGSHPMCGSERKGMEAAQLGLFSGAACILVPGAESAPGAVETVETFWSALNCRLSRMEAHTHDEAVARISHLPHAIAALLARVATREDVSVLDLAAGGFRDTTRVALGPPDMWREILLENRRAMLPLLRSFSTTLDSLVQALESGDGATIESMLEAGRRARALLATDPPAAPPLS